MKSISSLLFAILSVQQALSSQSVFSPAITDDCRPSGVKASANYTGIKHSSGTEVRLRISNGGAGQSGLVGALAQSYIDYSRDSGIADKDYLISWITGDTTDSINYLQSGDADIAITYNAAAEYRAGNLSYSSKRVYGFRDHFYLMGPESNPASLSANDTVNDVFNKLVTTGNAANATNPTRFLSRYDKSATNIKESLIFAGIGQIPWAYAYSKWYHQYPRFPIAALTAASKLGEYTLTDRGTYLTLKSQSPDIAAELVLYKRGEDIDPTDQLLNPASVLLGSKVCEANLALAQGFMTWMVDSNGGQAVVRGFAANGTTDILYTEAPDCSKEPAQCAGW